MSMHLTLVADASRARLFISTNAKSDIEEIETIAHPEGRLHEHNVTSDLPGRHTGDKSTGSDSYQAETEPKEQEMIDFAKSLSKHIDEMVNKHQVSQISIIAAPHFLGLLRKNLSGQADKLVSFELDKDLVQHSIEDIQQHLH